jgi:hypothetical protein
MPGDYNEKENDGCDENNEANTHTELVGAAPSQLAAISLHEIQAELCVAAVYLMIGRIVA